MGITRFGNKRVQKALQRWEKDIIDDVKDVIEQTLYFLKREIKTRVPKDTGYLMDSIEVQLAPDRLSGELHIGAEYAIYVNYGTGIHAMNGNGRKDGWVYYNERWGQFVFTMGQKPANFWDPALEATAKYFVREMRKIGK